MCPYKGIPDCFNCPLPDCTANQMEVFSQEALVAKGRRKERALQIKKEFLHGLEVFELADKYKVSGARISQILREQGISVRAVNKLRRGKAG